MPLKDGVESAPNCLTAGGEMGARMREFDWARTPLGAVEEWPESLKTAVSVCLNSRFAIVMWWGPQLVMLYNDAYISLIGTKHPGALGRAGAEVWPEIWETIGPMLGRVVEQGEASLAEDLTLALERNGYAEECNFTFSYSPIRDESGRIAGVFTPVMETTERVLGARRSKTLRKIERTLAEHQGSVQAQCERVVAALKGNPWDVPFAWVYLEDRGDEANGEGAKGKEAKGKEAKGDGRAVERAGGGSMGASLVAATGLCAGGTPPVRVERGDAVWEELRVGGKPGFTAVKLPAEWLEGMPASPWGDPACDAVVLPLTSEPGAEAEGFLVAGVSPRKRLDAEYGGFYEQIGLVLSTALGMARSRERERTAVLAMDEDRQRLRQLFESAPAGIALLSGPDHRFIFLNDVYRSLTQRNSVEDLLGKPIREALPELKDDPFFGWLDRVYQTGEPITGSEVPGLIERPGSDEKVLTYFNFVYQVTRSPRGEIDGILVYVLDVTPQVLARQAVEEREEQFRALANSIPQLAWMAQPDGHIFWYNQRWFEYTGKSPEEMLGWGWQSVHDPATLPEVMRRFLHSLGTGEPFDMAFPLIGADGVARTFLTRAVPVRDAGGQITRWFGTNTDIDTQRKTEAALRQSEKLAAVGRLASSIAHEINNPLEAVVNLVYLARESSTEDATISYLADAEQELARVAQITNQTLRFHKQQTAATPTDLAEVMNSVLTLYRGRLSRDGIELMVEFRAAPPLVCFGSEIRQVLANLIGNAFDAMVAGGCLRLRVREATMWPGNERGIRITVADTGTGMTEEVRRRMFEPFFTTKGATGTGLGLWVSAEIVEKHKGRVRVRSVAETGKSGTTICIVLPYAGVE